MKPGFGVVVSVVSKTNMEELVIVKGSGTTSRLSAF